MNNLLLRLLLALGVAAATSSASAREISIVFSRYTPPYVLDNGKGINVDIVRFALEHEGHRVKPVYLPLGRALQLFADKQVDGTALISETSGVEAHYSAEFVRYRNRVFALKSHRQAVRSLDDLKTKTIVGFQEASKYLGEPFGRAVAGNPNYKEMANQEQQTLMLFLGRIDLAIMEENIFHFYRQKLIAEGRISANTEYEVFDLFPPTDYKTAFVDAKVRDDFNRGLAAIRQNGQYDAIFRKYRDQFFSGKR